MDQPNDTAAAHITDTILTNVDDATAPLLVAISQQAVLPRHLTEGVYAVLGADGGIQVVETPGYQTDRLEKWRVTNADAPDHVARAVTVLDVASFLDYLTAYTNPGSGKVGPDYADGAGSLEVWADLDSRKLTGILDGVTGWRRHTATLQLSLSDEWSEWAAIDGKLLDQVTFAQFVEDHLSTIGHPDGATLLDVCQTLQAHTSVQFRQQAILANGQRQLRWEETVEAKAGQKGDLTIPGELILVLRPFQGAEPVQITARFRFQLREGQLKLGIKLAEPSRALEQAFGSVVEEAQEAVPVHIRYGRA